MSRQTKPKTTTQRKLFVEKIDGTRKRLYREDFKGVYSQLGEWLSDVYEENGHFIMINTVKRLHSCDYYKRKTFVQLEVIYEAY